MDARPPAAPLGERLLGPRTLALSRRLPVGAAEVRRALARFLEGEQVMRLSSEAGDRQVWERAAGAIGGLMHAFASLVGGGTRVLAHAGPVEVNCTPRAGGAQVDLRVHFADFRHNVVVGTTLAAVAGAGIALAANVLHPGFGAWDAAGLVAGAALALGIFSRARRDLRRERELAEGAFERLFDRIETAARR